MVSPNRGQEHENVTFDDVHKQVGNSGKQFNDMSLDELLKNVISVEDGSSSSSSNSTAPYFVQNHNPDGTLSKKIADDVWKEIVQQEHVNAIDQNHQAIDHQQLEDTTLEDYLVRAGVLNQHGVLNPQPVMEVDPAQDWLKYQMVQHQQQRVTLMESDFHLSESMYENRVVDAAYSHNQVTMAIPSISATSSESRVASGKKRRYSDEMDKTIERRQKRMIKNRESAARSRARKQAYTNLLEQEVFNLRKTNSWLKKQKEVDTVRLSAHQAPLPRYQLRRTSSATF